jgi:Ca2+-transporting ATPase
MTPPKREPIWKLFLEKFDDPIIRILLLAAGISIAVGAVSGHYAEGIGIIVAILLATGMAFWNEYKADREFDSLNRNDDEKEITVIREANTTKVPRRDLVVGDLVMLAQGDEVPADGEVVEAVSLQVDESSLTGEAVAAEKEVRSGAESAGDVSSTFPAHRAYRGTEVVDGHGILELLAVGDETEIGRTDKEAEEAEEEETPLRKQLDRLGKLIGVVGFGVAGLLFVALVAKGFVRGDLALAPAQWRVAIAIGVFSLIGLVRVWLPVVYDFLEIVGVEAKRPAWLESEGALPWLQAILGAGAVTALAFLVARLSGLTPPPGMPWLPPEAAGELLGYFMIAVTVIVVAVPEGLAMSVTLSLAYSMRRMIATKNLVRRMHACETIGAATVICTDKTGTLTTNRMRVHHPAFPCLVAESHIPVDGAPLDPALLIHEAMAANSTATLDRGGSSVKPIGNPTEQALLMWLESRGVDYLHSRSAFRLGKQWTFSTERKFMGTMGQSASLARHVLHLKGAPEILLERCNRILTTQGIERIDDWLAPIQKELGEFQSRGMRTLGFALRGAEASEAGGDLEELSMGLVWLGFVAIADPVRAEVPSAIDECRKAGIGVKMVTGDNRETAQEIARQIGLVDPAPVEDQHLAGGEFATMAEDGSRDRAEHLRILSRARPSHKLKLVRALQKAGHVVAVTGDGFNDKYALRQADVGLAMGQTGVDAAKEASDIILLDDSFLSITKAILWGRSLYQNIQRFILFQLTINVAALGIALVGPFLGVKLPFTVTQMLWVNLIMDTFAALALAAEPPHADVMNQPPRDPKAFIVTPAMGRAIVVTGGAFMAAMIAFLLWAKGRFPHPTIPGEIDAYGLTLFFTIFVMLQFWNLFNARCLGLSQSAFKGILANRGLVIIAAAILIGQIAIVQMGGTYFRTVPLRGPEWAAIAAGTSLVLWAGEAMRWLMRQREAVVVS